MDSKRITALRAIMKREGIDYYYIPTADFHESDATLFRRQPRLKDQALAL